MSEQINNFRSASFNDSNINEVLRTPYAGDVRALAPPPLPQAPVQAGLYNNNNSYYGGLNGMYGSSYGGFGSGYAGGFGSGYAGGYGSGYAGGYGSGYAGGFGGYGMYNRFGNGMGYGGDGMNGMDPESRFIQLAEGSARPAFQSIESLVSAIGNIATMLDSTFFALTSSFRAILGVAANFGRLRGVFAQFWHTFAIFRALNWLYKKISYWLHLSHKDPAKAIADTLNQTQNAQSPPLPRKGQSPWPVLAFLSFIFTAPYLIMKLLGTVANTAQEEARNPAKWLRPIETVALYGFQARNATELSFISGQRVIVAPKEIQQTQMLLNTGWALATLDGRTSGLVPLNYIKSPQQMRATQLQEQQEHLMPQKVLQANPEMQPNTQYETSLAQELGTSPVLAEPYNFQTTATVETPNLPAAAEIDFDSLKVSAFAPPPPSTMLKPQQKSTPITTTTNTTEL